MSESRERALRVHDDAVRALAYYVIRHGNASVGAKTLALLVLEVLGRDAFENYGSPHRHVATQTRALEEAIAEVQGRPMRATSTLFENLREEASSRGPRQAEE